METVSGIPVIDFSAMSVEHEAIPLPSDDRVQTIVRQIHEAFSTVGFVYLKNHGITQERVEKTFAVMDKFFTLSKDLKNKYRKKGELDANGWEALEREIAGQQRFLIFSQQQRHYLIFSVWLVIGC